MKLRRLLGAPAIVLVAGSLSFGLSTAPSGASSPAPTRLLVAAVPSTQLGPCKSATYTTIQSAIDAASPGDVVVVCTGTYDEDVQLTKPLTLLGTGNPIINATGQDNGILVVASGATVEGLTVENAIGEGILAVSVHDITIEHNVVQHNDQGSPTSSYKECQASNNVPGDCVEGLHLMGVADSQVLDNVSRDNSGGIVLTDETGPTHNNLVEGNIVDDNSTDCGITMPSHNGKAVSASGKLQPSLGGVYDNVEGDPTSGDAATTGIVVYADTAAHASPIQVTVTDNLFEGDVWAIWETTGTVLTQSGNSDTSVNGLVHEAS